MKGGFKLFGAEVSGTAGGFARVVAFGLGIIMILVGIGFHEAASPAPSP